MKPLSIFLAGLCVTAGIASVASGCGSSGNNPSTDAGVVPTFDGPVMTFGGGDGGAGGDGSTALLGALTITPTTPSVTVTTGQPAQTVQFTAAVGGVPTGVAWAIDRGELGTIDANGLFTPTGTLGGTATVTAVYGSEMVTTTVTVSISTTQQGDPAWTAGPLDAGTGGYRGVGGDGPGAAPSTTQMTALGGAPMADATVSILYPYDATVWPQGLLAPLLQWNAGAHSFDSVYVHIKEKNFEYQGYFAANKTPFANLPIPQAVWDAATLSNGGEPFAISLVFAQGASVFGPYTQNWTIAQAPLQGTIYYNSYGSALVKNSDSNDHYGQQYGAGTLAIAPGAIAPARVAGIDSPGNGTGCRVCHTVSADGKIAGGPGLERQRHELRAERLREPRQRHHRRRRSEPGDEQPRLPGAVQGRQPAALEQRRHDQRRHLDAPLFLARRHHPPPPRASSGQLPGLRSPRSRPTASVSFNFWGGSLTRQAPAR